jgi:hypothetical protein
VNDGDEFEKHFAAWSKAVRDAFDGWQLKSEDPYCCECPVIDLKFQVMFGHDYLGDDQTIEVDDSTGRSNMREWHLGDPDFVGNSPGVTHEVGHMFGLLDEYPDPVMYPEKTSFPPDASDSLMNNLSGQILQRHIEDIVFNRDGVNNKHGVLKCSPYKVEKQ